MKLVIISIPNNISEAEIKEGCAEFASVLELTSIRVNVLEEGDLQVENPVAVVSSIIDSIFTRCMNQDPLITIANFWRCVSVGEITKAQLQKLITHRNATKAHLKAKKAECFLSLFDEALKQM